MEHSACKLWHIIRLQWNQRSGKRPEPIIECFYCFFGRSNCKWKDPHKSVMKSIDNKTVKILHINFNGHSVQSMTLENTYSNYGSDDSITRLGESISKKCKAWVHRSQWEIRVAKIHLHLHLLFTSLYMVCRIYFRT